VKINRARKADGFLEPRFGRAFAFGGARRQAT